MHQRNIRPETRKRDHEKALYHLVLSYHPELHPRLPGAGYGGWGAQLIAAGVPVELAKLWLARARDDGWRMTTFGMPPTIAVAFRAWQNQAPQVTDLK